MFTQSKKSVEKQRVEDRRRREDEAPRLGPMIAGLSTLQISVIEHTATATRAHKRHIVVARAPALFEIACGDQRCEDGGHDITASVMFALRRHDLRLQGESECRGSVGSATCGRTIHFDVNATYTLPSAGATNRA